MIIEAFKSEYTGEIFETPEQYIQHIKEHAAMAIQNHFKLKEQENYNKVIHQPRLTSKSIHTYILKIYNTINELYPNSLASIRTDRLDFGIIRERIPPINYTDIDDQYLGWRCDMTFSLNLQYDCTGAWELLHKFPGLHIATGYGTSQHKSMIYRYNVYMYLLDFPAIHSRYLEYVELQNSANEWKTKIDDMIENECSHSLSTLKNDRDMLLQKLDIINANILSTSNNIESRILKNLPFKEQKKLNHLQKQFNDFADTTIFSK